MKNRYFSNAPRNHKLEGVKIKLCVMIVLFLYWVGVPDFWEGQVEIGLNLSKIKHYVDDVIRTRKHLLIHVQFFQSKAIFMLNVCAKFK